MVRLATIVLLIGRIGGPDVRRGWQHLCPIPKDSSYRDNVEFCWRMVTVQGVARPTLWEIIRVGDRSVV